MHGIFKSTLFLEPGALINVAVGLISSFIIILFTYECIGMALEHYLYGSDATEEPPQK